MKARDLQPLIDRIRRSTTNGDILTICDEMSKRLQHEIATSRPKSRYIAEAANSERIDNIDLSGPFEGPTPLQPKRPFLTDKPIPPTAMDAVVERAEPGRKPPTGKAKRALAKASARKAARKAAKT